MPTKTEYRAYIASEAWQERRREFLKNVPECANCGIPRWIAVLAYDQDMHVHHKTYSNLGQESNDQLQAVCKRCHEIKHSGESKLHKPRPAECKHCGNETWDTIRRICTICDTMLDFTFANVDHRHISNSKLCPNGEPWEWIWGVIATEIHRGTYFQYLEREYLREKAERDANPGEYDDSGWMPEDSE